MKLGCCVDRYRVDLMVEASGDGQEGGIGAHRGHEEEKGREREWE